MALTELRWMKVGTRRHLIGYTDDLAGVDDFRVEIPEDLPPEFATNSDYLYDAVKTRIIRRRARAQKRLDREAAELLWDNPSDEDASTIANVLAQLQGDLD